VRHFGGTKLGKGGLVRAYGGVVRQALEELPSRAERPRTVLVVEVPYEQVGVVRRLVDGESVQLRDERYAERVRLTFAVANDERARLESALAELGIELVSPETGA